MKSEPAPKAVEQEELDLLVDGELSEECRRDLLERLESDPAGWKRCALGFLESQAWQEAMSEETVAVLPRARRPWITPLATVAAAVAGFVAALLALPQLPPETSEATVAPAPEPEVRYVPYPVVQHTGLVPASDESGRRYYTARGGFPIFVLRALEEAGHDVEFVERVVSLPREDGEPLALPITETRIVEKLEL